MTQFYALGIHSAERILNQASVRKLDCGRCFNAHVNKKKSKSDCCFARALTDDEAREVEAVDKKDKKKPANCFQLRV